MTNTQLMVIPQLPVPVPPNMDLAEEVQQFEEATGETLDEILEEVAALELRYGADCERVTKLVDGLNATHRPIIAEIEITNNQIQALMLQMADSDDLEDQANAEDLKKLMDDNFVQDTEHETEDNEEAADREASNAIISKAILRKKCKALYKIIARITHPDKCRNLPAEEQKRRRELFLKAKEAVIRLDYEGLDAIHIELLKKSHDSLNLMERLLRARERRQDLYKKMERLRQSEEWSLYVLSLHYGESVASDQYRMSLEQTLAGLRQMLEHMRSVQSGANHNNHWV
ncbi:hypothetical protein pEaSNUABM28_00166 [Erwinia phage pEa_SNUABM_28]|uniref:J domain-containing protein n=1 Tax=Erwinia phage pEa_SNUABM_16 TaxID=2869544 RepID=A0AAE9BU35_9CAUD|nr:hypothetical protein MPK64_gp164 [Erwinia phage pEa_SNUABM_16]QZE58723.1 hypothetical protein pEaSNUABM28_00166 [Erwinia phage pEa_SNUABM_28]QZE59067.1 hypothetical protein pEaSNUABM18_00164 [Erwinia phage pEa_SNUABM_18]UAW96308.1 hypothetical protein pEaSNUABM16_00164 [Erwinia phage pEa_SNUABM_16]